MGFVLVGERTSDKFIAYNKNNKRKRRPSFKQSNKIDTHKKKTKINVIDAPSLAN